MAFTPYTLDQLPTTVLTEIFSYLDVKERKSVEHVCRRFREDVPWTIRSLRLSSRDPNVGPTRARDMRTLLRCCGRILRQVSIYDVTTWYCKTTVSNLFLNVRRSCPNLVNLELLNVPVESLDCIADLPLREVRLARVCLGARQVESFISKLTFLEKLELKSLKFSTGCLIDKKLRVLRLVNCDVSGKLPYFPNLEELRLACGKSYELPTTVSDNLRILQVTFVRKMETDDLVRWVCPQLHELSLNVRCMPEIQMNLSNCFNLKIGDFRHSGLKDEQLLILAELKHLTIVDISFLRVSYCGIQHLVVKGRLEELHAEHLTNVDEDCWKTVVELNPNLRLLDVSYTYGVTDSLVDYLKSTSKHLYLDVYDTSAIGKGIVTHGNLTINYDNHRNPLEWCNQSYRTDIFAKIQYI